MRLIDADKELIGLKDMKVIDEADKQSVRFAILEFENAPTVETIPKADYEQRLKADMVAMLEEIDLQFDEICFYKKGEWKTVPEIKAEYKAVIQEKINAIEGADNE